MLPKHDPKKLENTLHIYIATSGIVMIYKSHFAILFLDGSSSIDFFALALSICLQIWQSFCMVYC